MPPALRIVFDTNVLIEAALNPAGIAAKALGLAVEHHILLTSDECFGELTRKLGSAKFAAYAAVASRIEFLRRYAQAARFVQVVRRHRICADPTDDKFFDLADEADAHYVVTQDKMVLALKHFRGTQIVTASGFLKLTRQGTS